MRRQKRNDNNKLRSVILHLNNFLLLTFVHFSYRQRVITKSITLLLAYVSLINNLKLVATFLTMEHLTWKFQIIIHNSDFRTGILL